MKRGRPKVKYPFTHKKRVKIKVDSQPMYITLYKRRAGRGWVANPSKEPYGSRKHKRKKK